jgi:type IV secretory pathway VirB10-like protein
MPGTDAAGFTDRMKHHLIRVFGNALLLSIISAGVQLSQIPDFGRSVAGPTAATCSGPPWVSGWARRRAS